MTQHHMSKRFEDSLQNVQQQFLQMGGMVESMLEQCIHSLEIEQSVYEQVSAKEEEVNQAEILIDQQIIQVIAMQQPTGVDLRLLLSVSKMLTDMERCGDELEKVSKITKRLFEEGGHYDVMSSLSYMGKDVLGMLRHCMDAFARQDVMQATAILRADKLVNKAWKSILREMSTYMIEKPTEISDYIDLIFIARAFERIGDHTKNMAERIIYLVHGEDLRHLGLKSKEAKVKEIQEEN